MSWISWEEKMITGNDAMDQAHQNLVGLINQLADGMENNQPREFCSNILGQFVEHARTHFLAEEELMDRYADPKAAGHKVLHANMIKDVLAFKASYDAGDAAEFVTLLVILDSWLNRDIMAADKALAHVVAAAG